MRAPRTMNIENVKNDVLPKVSATFLSRSTKYCAATKSEPEASEVLHLPHGTTIMSKIKNDDSFTKRDFRTFQSASVFTKHCACRLPRKMIFTHACQRFSNAPRMPWLPRAESCTCHAKRRSRLQNAPDAPRLPHEMDIAQKTSMAR